MHYTNTVDIFFLDRSVLFNTHWQCLKLLKVDIVDFVIFAQFLNWESEKLKWMN